MNDYTNEFRDVYVAVQAVTNDVAVVQLSTNLATGKHYEATGTAKRDPIDRADPALAYTLAYGRALENLSIKILREANGLVKHHDDMKIMRKEQRIRNAEREAKLKRKAKRVKKVAS